MFRISKISTFESNSQQEDWGQSDVKCCSEYQRYQLLRAIHNQSLHFLHQSKVVPNIKDINFWEQFTTIYCATLPSTSCSEYQRYQLLRAIHNRLLARQNCYKVVPNIKDINFWEQFTTANFMMKFERKLFRISKISTFESNSQHTHFGSLSIGSCSEYQRYQLLRAIHNSSSWILMPRKLFRISKISTFESNSQHYGAVNASEGSCSEYQRYQLLRAIHNNIWSYGYHSSVVPNIKDINFWEQFTTKLQAQINAIPLFRISKISTFESNSQHKVKRSFIEKVVPNIKDINFWEQFTTSAAAFAFVDLLFRISKISTFESNSQPKAAAPTLAICCSEYQRYQLLRAIHN